MKIFYLCPDLTFPSGGIKRLYKHVQILNENGFTAYILHFKNGFKPGWFKSGVPVVYFDSNPPLEPGDAIVVPEGFPNVMKKFKDVDLKKIAIALNPLYPFQSLPPGESWGDYGFTTVLTPCREIADIISWSMEISDIHFFETSIDLDEFYYDPAKKRNQIAYIARKDLNTPVVEKLLKLKMRYETPFEFIKIENLKFDDYAEVLRSSLVFLSTSPYEGINRSVLEAMACGCICAGYHGFGSKDYIVSDGSDQNFYLAETMDFKGLTQQLRGIISDIKAEASAIGQVRNNAIKTARGFHPGLERDSILKFWSEFIQRNQ